MPAVPTAGGAVAAASGAAAARPPKLPPDMADQVNQRPQDQGSHAQVDQDVQRERLLSGKSEEEAPDLVDQEGPQIGRPYLPGDGDQRPLGGIHLLADGGDCCHAGDIEEHEDQEGIGR